ncbi:hypothetical protein [Saccharothrix deserti]|uniref:hypothetical protein n=1 Tax=Saccharothrix deserti TaxID=2593674 RepID=UPI00131B0659|nr:hypothetical protein [Saccharothrix deserti]
MPVGRAVRVLLSALAVSVVPSALVVSQPVALVPSGDTPPSAETASLRHWWPDGQPPRPAAEPAPAEPVAQAEPNAESPAEPGAVLQAAPQPGVGAAPSDGLSIAERNNRIATPRPSMDETLGEPVKPPVQVIRNDPPPPVADPTTDPAPPAPADPAPTATTEPPAP